MSTGRRKFTAEYRAEAAPRVNDSGRSIVEVARDLAVKEVSPGKWVRDERFELQRLRKKVVELKNDKAFLGKASADFAANPPGWSDSR